MAAVTRIDGERINEVKAYITAGALPSEVLDEFRQRLRQSEFQTPPGYRMEFGGEDAKRNVAVGILMASGAVLVSLIVVTLVVSFRSFRVSLIIIAVGGLSIGLGPGALWWFGYPLGFMAIVGTMGLVGVAINDAIVVMAGIRENPRASAGDPAAIREVVMGATRHVIATSLTTMVGFTPLVLGGGGFWPPLAVTIAGGVGGATPTGSLFRAVMLCIAKMVVANHNLRWTNVSLTERMLNRPRASPTRFMSNSSRTVPISTALTLCGQHLSIEEVNEVARGNRSLDLTNDPNVVSRMSRGEALVSRAVAEGARIYGVTTGFGSMAEVAVPAEYAARSQTNLLSFLAAGAGPRRLQLVMSGPRWPSAPTCFSRASPVFAGKSSKGWCDS